MKSSRILVTGGAGFIGSHLVESLTNDHYETLVIDNLSTGKVENLQTADSRYLTFEQADICDFSSVDRILSSFKPHICYHLAAIASVPKCEADPQKAFEVNLEASKYLLEKSHTENLDQFIFASSSAVYGDSVPPLSDQDLQVSPISVYGETKYQMEQFISQFRRDTKNSQHTSIRFFNIFGERQDPSSPYSGVISILIDKIQNGSTFSLYGDGTQTRDFVYVKDIISLLNKIRFNENKEVLCAGHGEEISLNHLIQVLEEESLKKILYNNHPPRKNDIRKSFCGLDSSALNNMKIKKTPLRVGLKRLIESTL